MRAGLSLLWYRSQRPGPAPAWVANCFAGPLLPYEETPLYSCHQHNQQAIALEKELQDIPIREPSRFITTALPLCHEHGQPTAARLFAAQVLPQAVLQRPMPDEGLEIALSGPKDALTLDCPGLWRGFPRPPPPSGYYNMLSGNWQSVWTHPHSCR